MKLTSGFDCETTIMAEEDTFDKFIKKMERLKSI